MESALQVTINGCCKPAAWQLTGPDDALDVLLPASGSRAAGVYVLVASGSFLAELAEWVVLTLGRLLQSSEGDAPILDPEVSWLALAGFAACCRACQWFFAIRNGTAALSTPGLLGPLFFWLTLEQSVLSKSHLTYHYFLETLPIASELE